MQLCFYISRKSSFPILINADVIMTRDSPFSDTGQWHSLYMSTKSSFLNLDIFQMIQRLILHK